MNNQIQFDGMKIKQTWHQTETSYFLSIRYSGLTWFCKLKLFSINRNEINENSLRCVSVSIYTIETTLLEIFLHFMHAQHCPSYKEIHSYPAFNTYIIITFKCHTIHDIMFYPNPKSACHFSWRIQAVIHHHMSRSHLQQVILINDILSWPNTSGLVQYGVSVRNTS